MTVFVRSIKAWAITVPALFLFFFVLFPPQTLSDVEESLGALTISLLFLGVPLFVVILLFNAVFNRSSAPVRSRPVTGRIWTLAAIGFVLAGIAAAFINGIIWEVWLVFATVGGMIGFIVGFVRR